MGTSSPFLAQFGIQFPIIQAPMAGVSTPRLAAEVSNAGGLGSIAIGASTAAQARQMIEDTRALTSKPFNVNVFCHAPAHRDAAREGAWLKYLEPLFAEVGIAVPTSLDEIYKSFLEADDALQVLLDLRPAVVSFHFGLPSRDRIQALHDAGIKTLATATNIEEALQIEQAGVHAIVAQGIEAGGHRGMFDPRAVDQRLPTSVLVRQIARRSKLPVIAAGGIMDGQGVKAALDLGAAAAQLGTAFILCPESAANGSYRDNLKSERAAVTQLTAVLSGRPARGMVNRFMVHGEAPGSPAPADYPVAYDAAKQLSAAAVKQGNHEFAAQWAGQGAPLARELSARDLVQRLVDEWRDA
jgi:nitronate monooxygenase